MNNKIAIESLSMDLMRVANGYYKGSFKMAEIFLEEAQKRIAEIKNLPIESSFLKVINKIPQDLSNKDKKRAAEDALMYSVMCKNYAKKYFN